MSKEVIQNNLIERFAAPLDDFYKRRIIFWQDGDKEFIDIIDDIEINNVNIVKLTGNNYFEIKNLLTVEDEINNYLVYDPHHYEKQEDNWLLDIELYSEVFRADYFSMKMDELHIEDNLKMRDAIKHYPKFLESKDRITSLKKLGNTYTSPTNLHIDIMAVLCGVKEATPEQIIISVLSNGLDNTSNKCIKKITKFGNIGLFWKLVEQTTGYSRCEDDDILDFASHVFISSLAQNISMNDLKGLEKCVREVYTQSCYSIVHDWMNNDVNDTLYDTVRSIEEKYNLVTRFNKLEIDSIAKSDIFPAIDEVILCRLFKEIQERVIRTNFIFDINSKRRITNWFKENENYYDCLYYIAKMQEFYLENANVFNVVEPVKIRDLYINNLYRMDKYYRKFHFAFSKTLQNTNYNIDEHLKECLDFVEGLYQNWFLTSLDDCWQNAVSSDFNARGYVDDITKQKDFYSKYVSNFEAKSNAKSFVIISDALRYEVGVDLEAELSTNFKGTTKIESMQAIFPSITKFGMAALLPNKKISIIENDKKVSVLVNGMKSDGLQNREKILQEENPNSIALKATDLMNMSGSERRSLTVGKQVVYIYHDIIDATGDKVATEKKVFKECQTAINEITNLVRVITSDMNGTNIYITADHGFLYTYKPLKESDKISKTELGKDVYDIGRRYALVSPTTDTEYLTPIAVNNLIHGIDIKGYAPKGLTRIKISGGGENFVHGGISIQELLVPVISYKHVRTSAKNYIEVENAELSLLSESKKVSNLIFSLDFFQKSPTGNKVKPCTYTIYFVDDQNTIISDKHAIIADSKSDSTVERVYRAKFNLKSMTYDSNKVYKLVIANETDLPVEIDFKIDIAFNTDFEFDL